MTTDPPTVPGSDAPGAVHQPPWRNMEYLFFLGLFVLWLALQVWVLPKAGVRT